MSDDDTNRTSVQDMALDLLREVRDSLGALEHRQELVENGLKELEGAQKKVEKKLAALTTDVNTVHKFQTHFATRLHAVETYCIEQPLQSIPAPTPRNAGDGKL